MEHLLDLVTYTIEYIRGRRPKKIPWDQIFAVGAFVHYNYTILQFFADSIFGDFQISAKSTKNRSRENKKVYSNYREAMTRSTFMSCI